MATTPKGYPYPLGTDRVADGDNAIQALATAVDTHLGRAAQGRVTMTIPSGGGSTSVAVSFPAGRFTAAPKVLGNIASNIPTGDMGYAFCWATGISATGCTLNGRSTRAGASDFDWIAIQV